MRGMTVFSLPTLPTSFVSPVKSYLLSAALVALSLSVCAQDHPERRKRHYDMQARTYYRGPVRFSAGAGVGLYNGDLTKGLSNQLPGPSFSLGVLYPVHPHWTVGTEATYFQIGSTDYLPERNLAFRGRNGTGTVFVRFEPLRDGAYYATPRPAPTALVKPYLKLGVGLALYSPKAYNGTTRPDDNTSFLRPERGDYPALAIVAPVGLGVTLRLTPKLNATAEAAYYFTTTDQFDDISTGLGRSSSALNDGYGLVELKLEYSPWSR